MPTLTPIGQATFIGKQFVCGSHYSRAPGPGYLAGESPGGQTTVDGVPVAAQVIVRLRSDPTSPYDGATVKMANSTPSGTWLITGLDPTLQYDVIARHPDHNDVIMSKITPTRTDLITSIGLITTNADMNGAEGAVELIGGLPPYSITSAAFIPAGLTPELEGHTLSISGTSTDSGLWNASIRVSASNGPYIDVLASLTIA